MLGQVKLNNKTYNEIFQQALTNIPILSNEWTDYNYSDPGINTLQVLSILKLFQQSYVDYIKDDVKCNLIKLLGYDIGCIKPSIAKITLSSNINYKLYANARLKAGEIIFETIKDESIIGGKLRKVVVYDSFEDQYFDATDLVIDQSETITYVFGKASSLESKLYFTFDNQMSVGEKYSIYIEIEQLTGKERNYIPKEVDFKLSKINWEIFTNNGWKSVIVDDCTNGFLQSGKIIFNIDKEMIYSVLPSIGEGYIIRAVLKESEYEFSPKMKNVYINVCDVKQIDTQAKSFIFDSNGENKQTYVIKNFISIYNNIMVLVRGKDGFYRQCIDYYEGVNKNNLLCKIYNEFNGKVTVCFNKLEYGFIPDKGRDVVKIVCYNDYLFNQKIDTKIYGFENQVIKLGSLEGIVDDDFELMVRVRNYDNEECFYNIYGNNNLNFPVIKYKMNSLGSEIKILDVNIVGDIDIAITNCVLSKGKNGNVKEGRINKFDDKLLKKDNIIGNIKVKNIDKSSKGKNGETMTEIISKIVSDISSTHSLVTKEDFESKVFDVPGISIHKVKAVCDISGNSISIVVKPNSHDKLPVLTEIYKKSIIKYLDKYRMITTQINIISPVYVPINVSGSIYIKPNYKDADKIIKNLIYHELDGVNGDRDFGYEIIYGELYSKIENLSCVDSIYSLSIDPVSNFAVKSFNSNILLDKNALSYMGNYNIEINNNTMMVM